ncbi:putative siderophore-binding lipoprotein YfiY precursor [compost metagenome]
MLKLRRELLLVCILTFVFVLAGCGGAKEAGNKSTNTSSNAPAAEAAQPESNNDTRTIEHAMGTTEIKGTPQRVVTLYQGATDVAVALGVKPVGVVESWVEQPIYTYLRQDLDGVPIVGLETQPNLEEISKLKPDLIVASKIRHEAIYEQLSQIAPTVVSETVFTFKETIGLMGKATNQEEKGNQLLADWDKRVADFKTKIAGKSDITWPEEVSVLNFRADHARIYASGFAPEILSELGFVFSASQQEARDKGETVLKLTSKESIPSMNGGVFFIFQFDDTGEDEVQKTYEEWTSHALWSNLDAVKNNQVFMVNEVFWNNGAGIIAANRMLDEVYQHYGLTP